jgi:hypothetical protein
LIEEIMVRLIIPEESKRRVITTLQDIVAADASEAEHNPTKQRTGCPFITDTCHSGKKVFLNFFRKIYYQVKSPPYSMNIVREFFKNHLSVELV